MLGIGAPNPTPPVPPPPRPLPRRHLPCKVLGLERVHVVSVECGWRHSTAVTTSGALHVWGWSKFSQLGLGDNL